MALPTYDQLMFPLMKLLSEQKQGMKLVMLQGSYRSVQDLAQKN